VGKSEKKTTLGSRKHSWVGNIIIHHKEMGQGGVDRVGLAYYREKWKEFVNTLMNHRVP
jgi:hypothetical protein